ncbi:Uncharacterised protein [Mycobacteroides abscessus subsp. abscessus]|nr:Uncharacterised protein [Mycobacteroides abscessus subsp. abscessus]
MGSTRMAYQGRPVTAAPPAITSSDTSVTVCAYPPQRLRTPVYRQPSAATAQVTMNSATIT